MSTKAIIPIDMTNDFVKKEFQFRDGIYTGRLVAPLGKTIIEPIENLIYAGSRQYIIYVEDEHTPETEEIKSGKYGPHNMKGTPGAETVDELKVTGKRVYNVKKDYYNGFTNPELDKLLKRKKIDEVYIVGLVQEVCIKENAMGFLEHGYKVNVVVDATAPFNAYAGFRALKEIEKKGARMINLETALKEVSE
ncbi:MAG: cysteine hydrolase [Candidatus Aenigmarchaeota archaeon]|nr:cysteine hydrolase [Candidatus Aenigmarchaeota archaeon]